MGVTSSTISEVITEVVGPTVGFPPSGPFSPALLAKINLWLDNSNISNSTWLDKSLNGNNATAASGEAPSLSGKELVFDPSGNGDAMVLDSEINLIGKTVYVLSKADESLSSTGQILSHTTDNVQIRYSTTLQTLVTGSPNLGGAFAISGADTTIYRVVKLKVTDTTAQMFYVGSDLQSDPINSHSVTEFNFNQMGRRGTNAEPLNGRIAAVLVADNSITAGEETILDNYMLSLEEGL
jgi:hypothetical protein